MGPKKDSKKEFELHDRDELVKNSIKEDVPLIDIGKLIQQELQKEKPVEEDPKKKGSKKQTKKETKEEKKDPKKDVKKDAKKKDAKLGEPIKDNKKPQQTISTNYGVVAYFLVDFLNPNNRHFKLKAPVVPRKTFEDFESKSIDLNTTARTEMQKVIASNNYFQNDTMLIAGFTLSYPIGSFVKLETKVQEVAAVEDKNKKGGKAPSAPAMATTPEVLKLQSAKPKDIYERLIYVLPYKCPQMVKTIQQIFYSINLKAMNLPVTGVKELCTIVLSPQQKANPLLDILTGIEILDNQFRLFILEGLKEGGIRQLNAKITKESPNTKQMKILKNSSLSFTERLYTDFNLDLKRIRLRPNLAELLLQPSIYIKSKVPEEICITLNRISDIKKIADNLKTVQSMNMWPEAKWLIQVERKFSDSLTYEDVEGVEPAKKTKDTSITSRHNTSSQPEILKTLNSNGTTLPRLKSLKNQTMKDLENESRTQHTSLARTYQGTGFNKYENYTLHAKPAASNSQEPVYMYASQKNNYYEKQMNDLREKISQDKNHIYTYGLNHLSLSISPNTVEKQSRIEQDKEKTLMAGKEPFHNVLIKTKQQRMRLELKPSDQDIQMLKKYPYHEQKEREIQILKNRRGQPLQDSTRPQFKSHIGRINVFSNLEVMEGQQLTLAQKQRIEKQRRKKQEEEEKLKRKGDPSFGIKKNYCSDKAAQLDKYKEILEGQAKKKGLLLPDKKIKEAKIDMSKEVGNNGVSAFIHDDFDKSFNPLVRVENLELSVGPTNFHNYQNPQYLSKSSVTKPLKKNLYL